MTKSASNNDFASLSFSPLMLAAIEKAGFQQPTDVQLQAIPPILEGQDVLARAETGSGKTAAFVLPLLENLSNTNIYLRKDTHSRYDAAERAKSNRVQILVLVPTRELAIQVRGVFEQLSEQIKPPLVCQSVFGGVKINPQMMDLRGGADILVATPGRLLDLVKQNAVKFNQLKTLVIDEVDRLMKGDFEEEIEEILKLLPSKRQNLMFTATFPDSIRKLVREIMKQPSIVNVDDLAEDLPIKQRVITVNHDKKNDLLAHLLKENDWSQVLIFCSAKRTCNNLVGKLEKRGLNAVTMHGDMEQSARTAALRDFKSGDTRILIATDVAARGIDIEQLPCVINYDLPRSPNDYVHRIGRTGRAGQAGQAISLIAHHEYQHFGVIERRNDIHLYREQLTGFEADSIAPAPPERSKPKKTKKKLSKKKRKRLNEVQAQFAKPTRSVESKSETEQKVVKDDAKIWPAKEPKKEMPKVANNNAKSEPVEVSKTKDEPKTKNETNVNEHIWGKR